MLDLSDDVDYKEWDEEMQGTEGEWRYIPNHARILEFNVIL